MCMVNNQCIHGRVKGPDWLTYNALMCGRRLRHNMTTCQPHVRCIGELDGSFTQSKIVHSLTNITRIAMSLRLVTLKTKLLRLNLKYKQELQKHLKC